MNEHPILDDIDRTLVARLAANSRISKADLAKELGMDPSSVTYRVHRLAMKGIIEDFTTVVDIKKVRPHMVRLIVVRNVKTWWSHRFEQTEQQEKFTKIFVEHVAEYLTKFKEIGFLFISEDLVLYLFGIFRNPTHFKRFIDTLGQIPFMKGSSYQITDLSIVRGQKMFNMSNVF